MAADPQTLAQSHSAEVWAAFCGAVTLIIGLVTVLYNRLNKDNQDLWKQVEQHRETLEDCKVDRGKQQEKIDTMKDTIVSINGELDRLDNNDRSLNDRLKTIEVEHVHNHELLRKGKL